MKKTLVTILAIASFSLLGICTVKAQSMGGGGMMGGGGYSGHGGGMMGGGGHHGYGGGMMGYDEGMVPYSPRYNHQDRSSYEKRQRPIQKREAREIVENYIRSTRNPNLNVGKIEDMGPDFKAKIVTKDGSLVDEVAVDKNSGSMRSLY
jgi:hypothetical protein